MTAKDILGNPDYLAISYGGYRKNSRSIQPTVNQLKEDLLILHAMGIRLLRTYNVHLPHASNVLKAISELNQEKQGFEMYVMLGAWIDCKNAWTDKQPDHFQESERNQVEIAKSVELANQYPEIVKIIAVGNEAMVKWAESYYVQPEVILKWVKYLQNLKKEQQISSELWITSSDDFSSWGGGDPLYHTPALNQLIREVDFVSMHTYPMHNTHYHPIFWGVSPSEKKLPKKEKLEKAMQRARDFAIGQYQQVKAYVEKIAPGKPVHIGETGWASSSDGFYGLEGSRACDEYKEMLYYQEMRNWTNSQGISCFYFEAFDEPWKDSGNAQGSENHFGLITVDGKVKAALWEQFEAGVFQSLTRDGKPLKQTKKGNIELALKAAMIPPPNEHL
ncbi:MAG TPA: glycosyl hydrolase family 17 [Algoriphagus sp.]|jgi:exo-beta-1,3-glucanase (GH17 family)|uniref:glycosyl hydrolase family 17 n=1 Tax=unclassified Algoriphagus TaxID=2641541 RepID=UPI000EBE0B87|nr:MULTISPECIES: glycosyl hydrolase family 17 [unclassified Algoriphagus]HCB47869.1 glycosyl hydrolase family 17 [Algoriphagus sp.]HCD88846.1 glycosyl hydrolase family 17 [Algoriphagus sp.]|tara:strand:+ start:5630 stop:6799 length:1170 start_codon:yes stop_codon:yes gene_type:complete